VVAKRLTAASNVNPGTLKSMAFGMMFRMWSEWRASQAGGFGFTRFWFDALISIAKA